MFIRKGGGRKFFTRKGGGRWRRQSSWKGLHPASTYQTGRRKRRGKGARKKEKDKGNKEKNMPGNQHQLIKLAGEKEEEREQEKEEHIHVKVIMQYHMQYVNLSILSTSTAI